MSRRLAGLCLLLGLSSGCGAPVAPPPRRPASAPPPSPYELDITEVTVAAYRVCVKEGGCTADGLDQSGPNKSLHCNWSWTGREDHPINCVSWYQAEAYCAWAGKRLPTEEEWEWAASSGKGSTYPWGDAAPDGPKLCWNRWHGGADGGTCPVGSRPAGDSAHGVKDLAGNVWEWTSSRHGAEARVCRGGGWSQGDGGRVRATDRSWSAPAHRIDDLGFRCARSLR